MVRADEVLREGPVPSLRDSCYRPSLPGTAVPGFHMPPLRG